MIQESRKDLKFCIAARVAEEMADAVAGMVRKAIHEDKLSQCSESMAVNTVFKDVISSEKYWKVQNSILLQNDILIRRPTCGSSYVTLSKKQLEDLSESLFHPAPRNRLKAMEYLIRCVFADSSHVISFWEKLGTGLQLNLTSPLSVISEASLQVYKKFLVSSTPEVILEVYISLLKVLGKILHKDFCMLNLSNTYLIADLVQLVNKFQRNVTKHWFRYPIVVITGIVSSTFACYQKCQWLSGSGKTGLAQYLWLFDEHALWLNSFLCGIVARKEVYQSLSKYCKFLWNLLETCRLYLNEEVPDESIACVLQSVAVLLSILEKREGRTCVLLLLSGTCVEVPSTVQFYSTMESIWTLVTDVCVGLFKANEINILNEPICRLMKNQIEKRDSNDQQIILWFFNKMPTYNNPPYLRFVSDCVSTLLNDTTSRKFVLNNTNELKSLLTEMSKSIDSVSASSALTDHIKIEYIRILCRILLEPLGALMFSNFEHQEMFSSIMECAQNSSEEYSNELLNFVVTLAETELGIHVLSENEEFVDFYFKTFSIETLLSERNMVLFCMQILNLPLPSTTVSEVTHYLMNKLENQVPENLCQDSDFHQWTICLNQHYKIIQFYNTKFLQVFREEKNGVNLGQNDLPNILPVPFLNCQNCSTVFKLSVLNYSICDLNCLLYIHTRFDIQQLLLNQQLESVHDGVPIVDEQTVLRNHVLIRISVIGGSTERSLPSKSYSEAQLVNIIQDQSVFTDHVLNNEDNLTLHNDINENELHRHLQEIVSSRTLSVKDCRQLVSCLVENIDEPECRLSNDTASKINELGITITLQYGKEQCWLSTEDQEKHHDSLGALLNVLPSNGHYNFLLATVFLICSGEVQTSAKFYSLLESNGNRAIPVAILFYCMQDRTPNMHRGVLCSVFDLMVQKEMPVLFNALNMAGFLPHWCLTHWLGQCFWNVLDMKQIAAVLILCVLENGNFLLYVCMAILKSLEPLVCEQFEQSELFSFLREYSPKDFHLSSYFLFMQKLSENYCTFIENKLNMYLP